VSFLFAGVEGWTDKVVLERILGDLGIPCGRIQDYGGCSKLDAEISKFLQMTHTHAVCVLRDLDDEECAPSLLRRFGVDRAPVSTNLVFRVPVRQIEAWLLADSENFARHFKVPKSQMPLQPDDLLDAKEEVLRLVRRSNSLSVREGMLPREGYATRTGPEYASQLNGFTKTVWNTNRARDISPSLDRSLRAFEDFKAKIGKASDHS